MNPYENGVEGTRGESVHLTLCVCVCVGGGSVGGEGFECFHFPEPYANPFLLNTVSHFLLLSLPSSLSGSKPRGFPPPQKW